MRAATALIRTSVLLEMGIRGGPQPHEMIPIGCLLGDVLEVAGTCLLYTSSWSGRFEQYRRRT